MKPSLGMIVHTQKVMPILSSVLVLIGFSDLVCRDQPRGHLSVDPSALGGKTLYKLASLKYVLLKYSPTKSSDFGTNTPALKEWHHADMAHSDPKRNKEGRMDATDTH